MRRRASSTRGESGQALIEFAFVAPLLFVILFAIFDVGQALNYVNDETNLANVVARYASVLGNASSVPACDPPGTATTYTTASGYADDAWGFVKCEAAADSSSLANAVGVCITDETSSGSYSVGDALKITVEYPYNFLSFLGNVFGKSHVTLSSNATMMLETAASGTTEEDTWLSNTNSDSANPAHNGSTTTGYTSCNNIT